MVYCYEYLTFFFFYSSISNRPTPFRACMELAYCIFAILLLDLWNCCFMVDIVCCDRPRSLVPEPVTPNYRPAGMLLVCTRYHMFRVCLPHQHELCVYHTNSKHNTLCIFSQTRPPRRVDCLVPLWEYGRKVSFPRTQRYITQFRNRTESRQPCSCQLVHISTGLRGRWLGC